MSRNGRKTLLEFHLLKEVLAVQKSRACHS